VQVVDLPAGASVDQHLQKYRASGLFDIAEPDYWVTPARSPNDPEFTNGAQWHLRNTGQSGGVAGADIAAVDAWDTLSGAPAVIVAVVDTGLLETHEDLAGNLWTNPGEIPGNGVDDDGDGIVDDVHGINAAANSGDIRDLFGHGTMLAGFIGAVGNNNLGVAGVSWNVQLMACRYPDDTGSGSISDVIQCFDYARSKGAKVINASFVTTNYSAALLTALNNCRTAGIVIVAAAGNNGSNNDVLPFYPGAYNLDNIITVAATDRFDALAPYSCYGATTVDLAAPGSEVTSTGAGATDAYVTDSGTSYSAAIVSGAMALMRVRYSSDTPAELIRRVLEAVDPLPSLTGRCVSGGRLNLARALGPSVAASFTSTPSVATPPATVQFTDTSFGSVTQWSWDFGDGAGSTQQNPSHAYSQAGEFTASLTVTAADGHRGTNTAIVSLVEAYGFAPTPYSWVDPSAMPTLALAQNGVSAAIALPFPFRFYNRTHSQIYVGANGLVGFSPAGLDSASNSDIPAATAPNDILCPFWDALNPVAGSAIHAGTTGVAPARRFVVSWVGVSTTGARAAPLVFQVVLEEATGRVVFQYQDVAPNSRSPSAGGKSATVGVEHSSGQAGTRYSYNGSSSLANLTALAFVPPPRPVLPPNLSLLTGANPGAGTVRVQGTVGVSYILDLSTNLADWTPAATNTANEAGVVTFPVSLLPASKGQFFRARASP
jgi:subtilisin family serine protease